MSTAWICIRRPCRTCFGTQPSADGACAGSTRANPCTWGHRKWRSRVRATKQETIKKFRLILSKLTTIDFGQNSKIWSVLNVVYLPGLWLRQYFYPWMQTRSTTSRMCQLAQYAPTKAPTVSDTMPCWRPYRARTQLSQSSNEWKLLQMSARVHLFPYPSSVSQAISSHLLFWRQVPYLPYRRRLPSSSSSSRRHRLP